MKKILLSLMALLAMTNVMAQDAIDFSAKGYENAQDLDGVAIKFGNATVTFSVGTGSTTPKYYNTGTAARLYGGNTMTITSDKTIEKITFTTAGGSNAFTEYQSWAPGEFADNVWTGSANSVVCTNNATSGHVRIQTITVEYAAGQDPEPIEGDVEKYTAISWDGTAYTVASEFAAATGEGGGVATNVVDGASIIKFGTANLECEAVGGTTAKTCDATGVTEWNDIKWDYKNQGDILFAYINGTGNPVFGYDIEEIITDGVPTGNYRQKFDDYYYTPDCGSMPAQGLYYKFTAKKAGDLKIYIWSNKGNRNTYLVDEATTKPVTYVAEGYINGQNDETGAKRWLTAEEIQALHDASGNAEKPYIIGAGNQNYWGAINYKMTAGQSVWLFQDSSQVGFQGYEFTPDGGTTGIQSVAAESVKAAHKIVVNGKVVIVKNGQQFNIAGQLVK